MMPYSDNTEDFWTGYFTSRANSKKQNRDGQANMQASSRLYSLTLLNQASSDSDISDIFAAQSEQMDAQGINQHHDGISGTAK